MTDSNAAKQPAGGGSGRKHRSFWKELPVLIIVALGLALLIKTFLVQAFYIPSGSMENTLQVNDRVLVNKLAYSFGEVERGDVIVFNGADSWQSEVEIPEPANAAEAVFRKVGALFGFAPLGEKDFIKRVIGLPGDTVKCCDDKGRVTVNGHPLKEKAYIFPGNKPSATPFEVTVPKGRLWVMGDHRASSWDSRFHQQDPGNGTVPIDHVVGRAFAVVWPVGNWTALSPPTTFEQPGLVQSSATNSQAETSTAPGGEDDVTAAPSGDAAAAGTAATGQVTAVEGRAVAGASAIGMLLPLPLVWQRRRRRRALR